MGFLIDTSLWIAIERGKLGAADIHAITKQAPIANKISVTFGTREMMRFGCCADTKLTTRDTKYAKHTKKPFLYFVDFVDFVIFLPDFVFMIVSPATKGRRARQ